MYWRCGTVGRGVFALYDVTSYFPQATALQFGLADNNSQPDASFLTRRDEAQRHRLFSPARQIRHRHADHCRGRRPTPAAPPSSAARCRLVPAERAAAFWATSRSAATPAIALQRRAPTSCSCSIAPTPTPSMARSRVLARSCSSAAARPSSPRASTYTGPTSVLGGTLSVNGSIASSPVFVDVGRHARRQRHGGPDHHSCRRRAVAGQFGRHAHGQRQSRSLAAASLYMVEVQGNSADRANATGAATLAGTVGALLSRRQAWRSSYTILSAAGRTHRHVRLARPDQSSGVRHREPGLYARPTCN